MTENTSPRVAGKAIYLELRKGSYTNQVLITPEGINTHGRYVPTSTYRRRISESQPRKTWRIMASLFHTERVEATGDFVQLDKEHALETVSERTAYSFGLYTQLIDSGHELYKQPFVVDVTAEDLDDVWNGKTPYKIMARVTRCRRALGFGEDLFTKS